MIGTTSCRGALGATKGSGLFLVTLSILAISSSAFGWGGPSHGMLASNIFNDSVISGFATEFGVDVNAVTSWTSEPPSDWHHPGWSMVKARGYLGTYNNKDWTSLSETTRLRYLTHILMDAGVPVSHSPANTVYTSTFNEGVLEAQASTWSDSPNISGISFSGTIASVNNTFESQCISNAQAFKNTRNWLGLHSVDDNRHHGWIGQSLALKMSRAVLADYFLAKRNTVAEAGGAHHVNVGGSTTFSSAGSYDPDSITWNSNATYYNNGGGISSVAWDLDNNGTYETAGSSVGKTHSQLVSTIGYTEGATVGVKVVDNEGKVGYDTTTVAVYSNPTVNASASYQTLKRNQTLYLKGSGSDADGGSVVSYAWDIDGDGQYDDATTQNAAISYATLNSLGLTAGNNYTVSMRGIDNDGAYAGSATSSFNLTMDTAYNVALDATVTVSSVHANDYVNYDPYNIVDGNRSGVYGDCGYWASDNTDVTHWITLEWEEDVLIDTIGFYSIGFDPSRPDDQNVRDFEIQMWDDSTSSWVTIDTINDNTQDIYTFASFNPLATDALRFLITDGCLYDYVARVLEIEVGNIGRNQMAPVPEPMTLAMLAVGGAVCLKRRRK